MSHNHCLSFSFILVWAECDNVWFGWIFVATFTKGLWFRLGVRLSLCHWNSCAFCFWHQFCWVVKGGLGVGSTYHGLFDIVSMFWAFTFIQSADSPFFRLCILHSIFYLSLTSHCLPFITVVPSTLSSHFLDSSLTVSTSPSAVSLRMVQQRQHSVASGWSRACREGWRCFLSLWSHASWQNRACKVCAASESHPSSFFVHLHLNSAGLWMPKQLTSQKSSERGCYLLEKQQPLICATVAFSFVLVGEGLMRAIIRAI